VLESLQKSTISVRPNATARAGQRMGELRLPPHSGELEVARRAWIPPRLCRTKSPDTSAGWQPHLEVVGLRRKQTPISPCPRPPVPLRQSRRFRTSRRYQSAARARVGLLMSPHAISSTLSKMMLPNEARAHRRRNDTASCGSHGVYACIGSAANGPSEFIAGCMFVSGTSAVGTRSRSQSGRKS